MSILTRCPNAASHENCRPPTVIDPEIPGAVWILCHTWVQVMSAAPSEDPARRDTQAATSPVAAATLSIRDDSDKWFSLDEASATSSKENNFPAGTEQRLRNTSRQGDAGSGTKTALPGTLRKGSAPIERDYATGAGCPSHEQWKSVYDTLDRTRPLQATPSLSNCSGVSKVVRQPAVTNSFIPVQATGKNGKVPLKMTARTVISDESSDSGDEGSLRTDTTIDGHHNNDGDACDETNEGASQPTSPAARPFPELDLRGAGPPIGSGSGVRIQQPSTYATRGNNAKALDNSEQKVEPDLLNPLGLHPHATIDEAKQAYISKVDADSHFPRIVVYVH